jgi:transporter family-2 protein
MTFFVLMALASGCFVGMSRAVNARLAVDRGSFNASWWNHAIGFLLLSVVVFAFEFDQLSSLGATPAWAFSGGTLGAVFVALSAYVFPRLGAARSALLIIGGQMIVGLAIDWAGGAPFGIGQPAGVALIVGGIYLTRLSHKGD